MVYNNSYDMVCLSFDTETLITSGFLALNKSTAQIADIIRYGREPAVHPLMTSYLIFKRSIQSYDVILKAGLAELYHIERNMKLLNWKDGFLGHEDITTSKFPLYTEAHARIGAAYP